MDARAGMEPDRPRTILNVPRTRDGELGLYLSADGRFLGVAPSESPVPHVDLFESASGQRLGQLRGEASEKLIRAAFDPQNRRAFLVTSHPDVSCVIRSWTIAEPERQPRDLETREGHVLHLRFTRARAIDRNLEWQRIHDTRPGDR